jgi:hypothetical protein
LGRIFDLGVCEGHIILIWGYAEGYNFDLGVRGYQKVENPWPNLSNICQVGSSMGLTVMLDAHTDILTELSVTDDFEGFTAMVSLLGIFL